MKKPTVAIITSTIGRPELARAIDSVKKQTYPCKHYIFVDGEQFSENVKSIVEKYDDLIITYLPMNTGANGWVNSSINAIAPYLVQEDIVCYLDDDNWYEPNHIQSIVETFEICPTADFVYSLRNLYDLKGNFICPDDLESLGIWEPKAKEKFNCTIEINDRVLDVDFQLHTKNHIDTNCYGFTRQSAIAVAPSWFSGKKNDQHVFRKIAELHLKTMPTRRYTVNYTVNSERYVTGKGLKELGFTNKQIEHIQIEILKRTNQMHIERYGGKRPWAEPNVSPEPKSE